MTGGSGLKARLREGLVVSVALDHVVPTLAEFLSASPLVDSITVDLEHANIGDDRVEDIIRVADLAGLSTIVRVPLSESPRAQRFLDAGAVGWKVPGVSGPEMAREAVSRALHPPRGDRGIGRTRSNRYGLEDFADAAERSNHHTVVLAMIESPEGVAAAEGIAAVDGVDCLLIGLVDLSASLAAEGAGAAELSDAVAAVAAATRLHGKALGLSAGAAETAARHREAGASLLTIPLNSLITTGLKSFESVLGGSR